MRRRAPRSRRRKPGASEVDRRSSSTANSAARSRRRTSLYRYRRRAGQRQEHGACRTSRASCAAQSACRAAASLRSNAASTSSRSRLLARMALQSRSSTTSKRRRLSRMPARRFSSCEWDEFAQRSARSGGSGAALARQRFLRSAFRLIRRLRDADVAPEILSLARADRCDRVLCKAAELRRPGAALGDQAKLSRFARAQAAGAAAPASARDRSREDTREALRALHRARRRRPAG